MQRAAVPYLEMLAKWIYEGKIDDPYDEFFIKEDIAVSPDDHSTYWNRRFVFVSSSI